MQGLHEFDQIGLPQFSIEMAEMPARIGSGGDQDVEAILDPLHRALDGAELRGIRVILGIVDQQHLGFDLVEIGLWVVVPDRFNRHNASLASPFAASASRRS